MSGVSRSHIIRSLEITMVMMMVFSTMTLFVASGVILIDASSAVKLWFVCSVVLGMSKKDMARVTGAKAADEITDYMARLNSWGGGYLSLPPDPMISIGSAKTEPSARGMPPGLP